VDWCVRRIGLDSRRAPFETRTLGILAAIGFSVGGAENRLPTENEIWTSSA